VESAMKRIGFIGVRQTWARGMARRPCTTAGYTLTVCRFASPAALRDVRAFWAWRSAPAPIGLRRLRNLVILMVANDAQLKEVPCLGGPTASYSGNRCRGAHAGVR